MSTKSLIRKRHDGDGWLVFYELANRIGFGNKRWADAFALGVWTSTNYETHLYEMKASRSDLIKELRDPTKSDGVGKYAKYRWLVLDNNISTEGLVIPSIWGILTPTVRGGSQMLKVVRKAPPQKHKPLDANFVIAMIRNATEKYVQTADHQRVVEELSDLKRGQTRAATPDEEDLIVKNIRLERELKDLKSHIERFEAESGVELAGKGYHMGQIGSVVKLVIELQEHGNAFDALGQHVYHLSTVAERMDTVARDAAAAAVRLRHGLGLADKDHAPRCRRNTSWSDRQCTCGKEPASRMEVKVADDLALALERQTAPVEASHGTTATPAGGDDDEGGRSDSGDARPPVQDAGVQLRDLGAEVPPG
jgi:hypothetical protein